MFLKLLKILMFASKFTTYVFIIQVITLQLLLARSLPGQSLDEISMSISIVDGELDEVLDIIKRETGFVFSYTDIVRKSKIKYTLNHDAVPLSDLLYELAKKGKLQFKRVNNNISVKKTKTNSTEKLVLEINRNISGIILDEKNEPVFGATIKVQGTTIGTISDYEGKFSLDIPDDSKTLIVTYVGYIRKAIPIGNQNFFEVILEEDVELLSEVVVVGYGTQKTATISSSVQQIESEELEIDKRPISNLESGLVGSVPGLILSQNSGQLGTDIDIQVRSIGSLNNNAALILVDGIETSIQNINPNDIASISVLKDASATSIYGTKGANGVVLITTKEGEKEKPVMVTMNTNFSWQSPGNTADMLNSEQFMTAFNNARANESPNLEALYSEEDIARAASGFYPETNWVEELYNDDAIQSSQNLSIQGGSKTTSYFIGLGYLKQDGISQGPDNLERISLRLKIDTEVNEWLTIGGNIFNANRTLNNLPTSSNNGLRGQPFYPVQLDTGRFTGTYVFKGSTSNDENPIAAVNSGSFDKQIIDELNLQLYTKIFPFDGFSVEGRVSYIKRNNKRTIWNNPYEYIFLDERDLSIASQPVPFSTEDRTLEERASSSTRVNTWLLLNYIKTFNEEHNFDFLLGYQRESGEGAGITASRNGFILDNLQSLSLGTSIPADFPFGNESSFNLDRSVLSYFGRIGYDYRGKYLAEFSARADASSNFVNDQWAFSPALSLGWNISDEDFLYEADIIDVLKLRASWGFNVDDNIHIANSNLVANREVVVFNPSGIGFGTEVQPTILLANAINPTLTWEKSEKINIGMDLVMWKGKLTFNADYFIDNRTDMIAAVQTSIEGGLTNVDEDGQITGGVLNNVYDAQSSGWELSAGHKNKIGQVSLNAGVNFSYYKSELTDGPTQIIDNERILTTGQPILGSLFGYETAGFFNNQAEIDNWVNSNGDPIDQSAVVTKGLEGKYLGGFRFIDQNNDGLVNADDRIVILNDPIDNFRVGAFLKLSYRSFSISARIYGVLKGYEWLNNSSNVNAFASSGVSPFRYQIDTWSRDNTDALFAESYVNSRPYNAEISDLIIDRDYIKLKNINLSYTFSDKLLQKLKVINGLDVYLSIEDLGVLWTNYELFDYGFDPEFGADGFNYPQSLKTAIGANIRF